LGDSALGSSLTAYSGDTGSFSTISSSFLGDSAGLASCSLTGDFSSSAGFSGLAGWSFSGDSSF
jgi:hypothetical protein